jgi:hypothetical protein
VHKGVTFYDKSDERIFLEWWSRIPCVEGVYAEGNADGLFVRLKRRPGKGDLRQILALCRRYGVDMRQLARFETAKNRSWFCDPKMYWYQSVFGKRI